MWPQKESSKEDEDLLKARGTCVVCCRLLLAGKYGRSRQIEQSSTVKQKGQNFLLPSSDYVLLGA